MCLSVQLSSFLQAPVGTASLFPLTVSLKPHTFRKCIRTCTQEMSFWGINTLSLALSEYLGIKIPVFVPGFLPQASLILPNPVFKNQALFTLSLKLLLNKQPFKALCSSQEHQCTSVNLVFEKQRQEDHC